LALRLGSVDPTYYFHAGMIAKAAGDRALALRYLRRSVRLNPEFSVRYSPEAERVIRSLEAAA
ncbi:MAG TPA: hypothetical protein VHV50_11425, partial [Actinomycetota bacterium]|nr:hypothetical protein [Actinomycetota bacterium]